MMKLITYNPSTGEITGRVMCSNKSGQYAQAIEVTDEEFNDRPELFTKVNVATKARERLTAAEARAKGVDEATIAEKIAQGKLIET